MIAIASLMLPQGDSRWREHAEEALQLARQLGDVRQEIELLLCIGQAAYGMDDLERAKHYLDTALSICQTIDDRFTELRLLNALGGEQERLGNYYLLLTEYEHKRLQICREIGYRIGEGFSLMFCAQIQGLYLGDYENAIDMANEALDIT